MNFTIESAIVQTWIRLIKNGEFTREQVPQLGNLQEVVYGFLDSDQ